MFETRRIVGETVREIGILTFVFAPLDVSLSGLSIRAADMAAIVIGAVGMMIAGIMLETTE